MYFTDETFYICVVMVPSREKVFLMNKADDIIDRIVIDRNAGVAILCKQHSKLFHGDRIWGSDSESEMQTLTVHIKWLREKIEQDPKNPKHIITVWGTGYRYEAL